MERTLEFAMIYVVTWINRRSVSFLRRGRSELAQRSFSPGIPLRLLRDAYKNVLFLHAAKPPIIKSRLPQVDLPRDYWTSGVAAPREYTKVPRRLWLVIVSLRPALSDFFKCRVRP